MSQLGHELPSTGFVVRLAVSSTSLPEGDDDSSWGEQVKKNYAGQVTIAKDLMSFEP
jgi:hypothetical protein